MRTWDRPLDEIARIKYVRANLSQKDWDAFIELYGIPGWIVFMPPNTPPAHGLTAAQIAALRSALAPHADRIERVDLFGSRATGRARPNSEVDLVIRGDVDEALVDRLRTLFAEAPIALTVDIVADGLVDSPGLAAHIARVRRPLFTRADLTGEG